MSQRLLAIDTATAACSAALFEDGQLIASTYREIGRGHAEQLIPMIADLPDKGRADEILVNCGPGSFTGVRIGISAAKALALAWKSDLSGYQSLHLVAAQAREQLARPEPVFVVMAGGHGEFFVQNFARDGAASDELESLTPDAAIAKSESLYWAGSSAIDLSGQASNINVMPILPNAEKSLLSGVRDGKLPVSPIYGRAPDAQPPKAR